MRAIGIDLGQRRIGVAITDESKTLARPLVTLHLQAAGDGVEQVMALVERLMTEDGSLDLIVVGLPRRLDGSPNERTSSTAAFVDRLRARTPVRVVTEDERLSSREAESRLALFRKSWRDRKSLLDAASAAVILQDYLDRLRPTTVDAE